MRLRIFDWATRKFWVVALWEDRTLRVSFRGPEDGTWFRCWKWEPEWKPDPPKSEPYVPPGFRELQKAVAARNQQEWQDYFDRMAEQFQKQSVPRNLEATPPYTSHEQTAPRHTALEAFKLSEQLKGQAVTRQDAWFKSLEEMQCENMEAALNSPWLGKNFVIPEGANTIAKTGGVREFKIPADASAPPMPAPDRVEYFSVDDLIENPDSASAQAASARNWLMKEAALRARIDAKIDAKIDADDLLKYPIESKCVHPVTIGSVQLTGDLAAEVLAVPDRARYFIQTGNEVSYITPDGQVLPPEPLTE